jgi:hypothetical protein
LSQPSWHLPKVPAQRSRWIACSFALAFQLIAQASAQEAETRHRKKSSSSATALVDQFLFQPSDASVGDWNPIELQFDDVHFEAADSPKLHGWYCRCPNAVGTVLIAHGNAGNVATRTGLLKALTSELQVSVFLFDYRGYGNSQGRPSIGEGGKRRGRHEPSFANSRQSRTQRSFSWAIRWVAQS